MFCVKIRLLFPRSRSHMKVQKLNWMLIYVIPSVPLISLQPNWVWWAIVMDQSVMQEDWFAIFKVKVTVRAHIIRYDCFYHICWTSDLFVTKFIWMVHHHKLKCFVSKLDCSFQGQDHSAGSKLYWIFIYLISSLPLISWQPKVWWFSIHSNQSECNKVGI